MDRRKFKLRLPAYSTPLILLLLAVLAFGLLVRNLGFYWDDWPAAWYYHAFGSAGFKTVFAADRPLLGWLYTLTTPLMGTSPLKWQLFGLLALWFCASMFWLTIWSIWPRKAWLATTAAILFLVYPGFSQQPIAITYSHVWLLMSAMLASLITMIWAVRQPRWFWPLSVLSWLLSAFTLFTVEYFFGLELLRPVILWVVLADKYPESKIRIRQVIKRWLPYLVILGGFIIWRIFLTNTPRGQVTLFADLAANPLTALSGLLQVIFESILEATINAWGMITQFSSWFESSALAVSAPIWMVLIAGLMTAAFLWVFQPRKSEDVESTSSADSLPVLGVGLSALLLSGIPFWVTDLPIRLEFPWDRFTLAMMFGISLIGAGLLELVVRNRRYQIVILSLIVGLSVAVHQLNLTQFRGRWAVQEKFFWQLAWRAPQIESGTVLLTDDWAFQRSTDNSLTAPLNWTYAPDNHTPQMPYLLANISSRLGLSLPGLEAGLPVEEDYRIASFSGSTSQALVIYYEPPNCLRILDPDIDHLIYRYPNTLRTALPLSRLELIDTQPEKPAVPAPQFSRDPRQDWCYYYEHADLAVHEGDYESAAELGDVATGNGLSPHNPYEYLPFIEANGFVGHWKKAANMSRNALKENYQTREALCAVWGKITKNTPDSPERQQIVTGLLSGLGCAEP
ncbi:MAG: hypothetical protein ACK2UW_08050 [Anaerolineales bacterium]